MDVIDDPRFRAALAHFEGGDWLEASDAFEELFFEAVRDEVEFVRVFLQIATGMHHVSRGSRNAAVERLSEGVLAIERVTNDRGLDLGALREDVLRAMGEIRRGSRVGLDVRVRERK